jgi:hypothetical protein
MEPLPEEAKPAPKEQPAFDVPPGFAGQKRERQIGPYRVRSTATPVGTVTSPPQLQWQDESPDYNTTRQLVQQQHGDRAAKELDLYEKVAPGMAHLLYLGTPEQRKAAADALVKQSAISEEAPDNEKQAAALRQDYAALLSVPRPDAYGTSHFSLMEKHHTKEEREALAKSDLSPGRFRSFAQGAIGGLSSMLGSTGAAEAEAYAAITGNKEVGERASESAAAYRAQQLPPTEHDTFRRVGEGAGTVPAMLLGGPGLGLFLGEGFDRAYTRAIEHGATPGAAGLEGLASGLVNAAEMYGVGKLTGGGGSGVFRAGLGTAERLGIGIKTLAKSAGAMSLQASSQQIADNFIAWAGHNEGQLSDVLNGADQAAWSGFKNGLGFALFSFIHQYSAAEAGKLYAKMYGLPDAMGQAILDQAAAETDRRVGKGPTGKPLFDTEGKLNPDSYDARRHTFFGKALEDAKGEFDLSMERAALSRLGLELGATPGQIQAAYRERSKKEHPDMAGGSEESFKDLSAAYSFLSGKSQSYVPADAKAAEAIKPKAGAKVAGLIGFDSGAAAKEDPESIERAHMTAEAKRLGLKTAGRGPGGTYRFTDPETGRTFSVKSGGNVEAQVTPMRENFRKAKEALQVPEESPKPQEAPGSIRTPEAPTAQPAPEVAPAAKPATPGRASEGGKVKVPILRGEDDEPMENTYRRISRAPDNGQFQDDTDALFYAEMLLRDKLSGEGMSSKSEASYWSDGGESRLRLASHDVVHPESDTKVFLGVGNGVRDADVHIPSGATKAEVKAAVEEAVNRYQKPEGEDQKSSPAETPKTADVPAVTRPAIPENWTATDTPGVFTSKGRTIDTTHDEPLGGSISADGKTVRIDKDIPREHWPAIVAHELAEFPQLADEGYRKAHNRANRMENLFVGDEGEHNKPMKPYIDAAGKKAPVEWAERHPEHKALTEGDTVPSTLEGTAKTAEKPPKSETTERQLAEIEESRRRYEKTKEVLAAQGYKISTAKASEKNEQRLWGLGFRPWMLDTNGEMQTNVLGVWAKPPGNLPAWTVPDSKAPEAPAKKPVFGKKVQAQPKPAGGAGAAAEPADSPAASSKRPEDAAPSRTAPSAPKADREAEEIARKFPTQEEAIPGIEPVGKPAEMDFEMASGERMKVKLSDATFDTLPKDMQDLAKAEYADAHKTLVGNRMSGDAEANERFTKARDKWYGIVHKGKPITLVETTQDGGEMRRRISTNSVKDELADWIKRKDTQDAKYNARAQAIADEVAPKEEEESTEKKPMTLADGDGENLAYIDTLPQSGRTEEDLRRAFGNTAINSLLNLDLLMGELSPKGRVLVVSKSGRDAVNKWKTEHPEGAKPEESTEEPTTKAGVVDAIKAMDLPDANRKALIDRAEAGNYQDTPERVLASAKATEEYYRANPEGEAFADSETGEGKSAISLPEAGKPVPLFDGIDKIDPAKPEDAKRILAEYLRWSGGYDELTGPKGEVVQVRHVLDKTSLDAVDAAYKSAGKELDTGDPDTKVWALPGHEKEMQANIEAAKKAKPAKIEGQAKIVPFKKRVPPGHPPPAKTPQDRFKATGAATAKVASHYAIAGVFVDGNKIVATDGHRMFIAKGKKGEWGKDGIYEVGKGGAKGAKIEGNFPRYSDVIPKVDEAKPTATVHIESTWRNLRRSDAMRDDERNGAVVVLNPDGSLGFATYLVETGSSEINVKDGYKVLGAVDPTFMREALEFHARHGESSVKLWFENPNKPFVTKSERAETVTMPVDIGGDSRGITEAKSAEEMTPAKKPTPSSPAEGKEGKGEPSGSKLVELKIKADEAQRAFSDYKGKDVSEEARLGEVAEQAAKDYADALRGKGASGGASPEDAGPRRKRRFEDRANEAREYFNKGPRKVFGSLWGALEEGGEAFKRLMYIALDHLDRLTRDLGRVSYSAWAKAMRTQEFPNATIGERRKMMGKLPALWKKMVADGEVARFKEIAATQRGPTASETRGAVGTLTENEVEKASATFSDALQASLKRQEKGRIEGYKAGMKEGALSYKTTVADLIRMAKEVVPQEQLGGVLQTLGKLGSTITGAPTGAGLRGFLRRVNEAADRAEAEQRREAVGAAYGRFSLARETLDAPHMRSNLGVPATALLRSLAAPKNAGDRLASFNGLVDALGKLGDAVREQIDPDVIGEAKDTVYALGDKDVRTLETKQIDAITNALKQIVHLNKTQNEFYAGEQKQKISEAASDVVKTTGQQKRLKPSLAGSDPEAGWIRQFFREGMQAGRDLANIVDHTSPDYDEERGTFATRMIDNYQAGVDKAAIRRQAWADRNDEFLKKGGLDQSTKAGKKAIADYYDPKKGPTVEFEDGSKVQMSRGELKKVYALLQDPDRRRLIIDRKAPLALGRGQYTGPKPHVTEADAAKIADMMEPWEKEQVQWNIDHLTGNDKDGKYDLMREAQVVDENIKGFARITRQGYVPSSRSTADRQTMESPEMKRWSHNRHIENESFFRHRAEEEEEPAAVLVKDYDADMEHHIDLLTRYIGLAEAGRDMRMLLGHPDVKHALVATYGQQAIPYWTQVVNDSMGSQEVPRGMIGRAYTKLLGQSASSVVKWNPTVMAKQPARVCFGVADIGVDVLRPYKGNLMEDFDAACKEFMPQFRDRYRMRMAAEFFPQFDRPEVLRRSGSMGVSQWLDKWGVAKEWAAIKREAEAERPDASREEIGRLVNQRLLRFVAESQNPISAPDQPGLTREGKRDLGARTLMTLSGETTAIVNRIPRIIRQARLTGNWGRAFRKLLVGNLANAIWVSAVGWAASAAWGSFGTKRDRKRAWEYPLDILMHLSAGIPGVSVVADGVGKAAIETAKREPIRSDSVFRGSLALQPEENVARMFSDIASAVAAKKTDTQLKHATSAVFDALTVALNLTGKPTAPLNIGLRAWRKWIEDEPSSKGKTIFPEKKDKHLLGGGKGDDLLP